MIQASLIHLSRAERRAAPWVMKRPTSWASPARARRETRLALVASKPAQAGSEPRHWLPSGERRRTSSSRLLGNCPPERHPAWKPDGRPTYSTDEGLS